MNRMMLCIASVVLSVQLVACAQTPQRVRVLTYNIHIGIGEDGVRDLQRTAKLITSLAPDVVALQEVDSGTKRSLGVDQAAKLGALTGMHARFGAALPKFDGGQYGEAVLSRWPITQTRLVPLPADAGFETRAALAIEIAPGDPSKPFWFIGTHLDHTRDDAQRLKQIAALNAALADDAHQPAILAGDFNAEPESEAMAAVLERWTDTQPGAEAPQWGTWPSKQPTIRIDYVLVRPAGAWRVVQAKVIDDRITSDHRPVLVVLERLP